MREGMEQRRARYAAQVSHDAAESFEPLVERFQKPPEATRASIERLA